MVVVQGEADLLEVIRALGAASRLASCLHRGQQKSDEDGDDRDDHQELDERKPPTKTFLHGNLLRFRYDSDFLETVQPI